MLLRLTVTPSEESLGERYDDLGCLPVHIDISGIGCLLLLLRVSLRVRGVLMIVKLRMGLVRNHGRAFIHRLKLVHGLNSRAVRQVEVKVDRWLLCI